MIGALLAGGYGKRLHSLTEEIPKVLLPLRENYVILDRQLEDFKKAGIETIYILTGFKGRMIEERYGKEWNGMSLRYLREEVPMGTLWAVRNLFLHTDSDVLLRNGDTICDLELRKFVDSSLHNKTPATIMVVKMRSPFGIVSIRGRIVRKFSEKPVLPYYIDGGTYFLKRGIGDYLKRSYRAKDIEDTLFKYIATRGMISAFKYKGFWKPIDTAKDYEEIRNIFR